MKLKEAGIVCFRAITVVLFVLNITKFCELKESGNHIDLYHHITAYLYIIKRNVYILI